MPFMLDRPIGRGVAMTVGLPSSAAQSDLALRPGFLALLDHVIEQALRRSGPRRSVAGTTWSFPAGPVTIQGPDGPLEVRGPGAAAGSGGSNDDATAAWIAVPGTLGRYRVKVAGETHTRIVTLDPAEITTRPRKPDKALAMTAGERGRAEVDASPGVALALLGLLLLELLLRLLGPLWTRGRRISGYSAG